MAWSKRGAIRMRILLAIPLTVAVLTACLILAGATLSAYRARWVTGRWDAVLADDDGAEPGFRRERNEAARRVERLAGALGVVVTPRRLASSSTSRPGTPVRTYRAEVRRAIRGWVGAVARRPRRDPAPAPPEVAGWLDEQGDRVNALIEALAEGQAPRWDNDLRDRRTPALPSLRGLLDLHDLLLAAALDHARAGRRLDAWRALEASWRLVRDLREHPVLIAQLVGISADRTRAGVLRQIPGAPPHWGARLDGAAYRRRVLTALALEGRGWIGSGSEPGAGRPEWLGIVRPVLAYGVTGASETLLQRVERLRRLAAWCDRDLGALGASLRIDPAWRLVRREIAALEDVPQIVARLELDLELTAAVLEADARSRDGLPPLPASNATASHACPGDVWTTTRGSGGSIEIVLDRQPVWSTDRNDLPLRFTFREEPAGGDIPN